MSLSHEQIKSFCEASSELLKPDIGPDNFTERAYAFLETLIPCEFIAFGTLQIEDQQLEISANHDLPNFAQAMEGLGSVMTHYKLFDWDPAVNDGKPFTRGDFFSQRQFRDTDVYELTMKPLGVDNHCAVYVPEVEGEISFFGIERLGGPDYSVAERKQLMMAQSLLGSARRLANSRDELHCTAPNPAALVRAGLTAREAEVLTLLATGKANDEIAFLLHIKLSTVKEHLGKIFLKTGTTNRLAAVLWALKTTQADEMRSLRPHLPKVTVPVRGLMPDRWGGFPSN